MLTIIIGWGTSFFVAIIIHYITQAIDVESSLFSVIFFSVLVGRLVRKFEVWTEQK